MDDRLFAGGSPAVPDIRILDSSTDDVLAALKGRSVQRDDETERVVKAIIDDVRLRGDAALLDNARRFDAPGLESIVVTEEEIATAAVDTNIDQALRVAYSRIADFHGRQTAALMQGWTLDSETSLVYRWDEDSEAAPPVGQRLLHLDAMGPTCPAATPSIPARCS